MRFLVIFFAFSGSLLSQAPDGWKRVVEASKEVVRAEGEKPEKLGVWKSLDGEVEVGLWKQKEVIEVKGFLGLLDIESNGAADSSLYPSKVGMVPEPWVGFRVGFGHDLKKGEKTKEHWMIQGENEVLIVKVQLKKGVHFDAKGWAFPILEKNDAALAREELRPFVREMNDFMKKMEPIRIDSAVQPLVADKEPLGLMFKVVINAKGEFLIDGKVQTDEMFAEACIEAKATDENVYLKIVGHQDSVFKHCRRAIRIAAKHGINKVVFGEYRLEANAILLNEKNQFIVQGKVQTAEALEAHLRELKKNDSEVTVQIQVEAAAKQQGVIDLLNILAKLEITNIRFVDFDKEVEKGE